MIPDWLQHLHGTVHGYWYYGCDCYRCYAKQSRDCGNTVMSPEEWNEQNQEAERVSAMPPAERDEYFRLESAEMMKMLEKEAPMRYTETRSKTIGSEVIPTGDGGQITVVDLRSDHEAFNLRTAHGRNGVSVRLNGSEMDHLIRELIQARGGEWLDALD